MMTTTDRLTALAQIEQGLLCDLANRPTMTFSRGQIMNRTLDYCDHPDTTTDDIIAIHSTLLMLDIPIRD